jgi:hypothetical protein
LPDIKTASVYGRKKGEGVAGQIIGRWFTQGADGVHRRQSLWRHERLAE